MRLGGGLSYLMRHDAHAGRVFVDENMIGSLMGAGIEYMLLLGVRDGDRPQSRDNRLFKPRWERRFEELILHQIRGP